jgi:hypothetical protein
MNILNGDYTVTMKKTEADPVVTQDTVADLFNHGFILVGSRRVIPNRFLNVSTDYDYMGTHDDANIKKLYTLGFEECEGMHEYFDEFTKSIWKKQDANVQVVLKELSRWNDLKRFWEFMSDNPKLFCEKIWKSNPKREGSEYAATHEEICANLEYMMNNIVPFLN